MWNGLCNLYAAYIEILVIIKHYLHHLWNTSLSKVPHSSLACLADLQSHHCYCTRCRLCSRSGHVRHYRRQTSAEVDVAVFIQPWRGIFGHIDADGAHNIVPIDFTVLYIKS